MKYSFHPSAKIELQKAINYYEECQPGLGLEFAREVYSTIQRIIHFPEAWSKLSKNTRRCLTNRFPYYYCSYATKQRAGLLEKKNKIRHNKEHLRVKPLITNN